MEGETVGAFHPPQVTVTHICPGRPSNTVLMPPTCRETGCSSVTWPVPGPPALGVTQAQAHFPPSPQAPRIQAVLAP